MNAREAVGMRPTRMLLATLAGLVAAAMIAPNSGGAAGTPTPTDSTTRDFTTSAAVREGELSASDLARGASPRRNQGPTAGSQMRATTTSQSEPARVAPLRAIRSSPLVGGKKPGRPESGEPYVPQEACVPIELPGVAAFRQFLLGAFPRPPESLWVYNILRGCNVPGISEHEEGRALDFEADVADPVQLAQATRLLDWLTAHSGYQAKRFGIMYMIYRQRIWALYKPYWRRMSNRGNKTANHRDHIHFTFTWNGALKRSSYWTGRPSRTNYGPCAVWSNQFAPASIKRLQRAPRTWPCADRPPVPKRWRHASSLMYWQAGGRVRRLQEYLVEQGLYRLEPSGAFDQATYRAIRRWQRDNDVPRTGVWDVQTQHVSGLTFVRPPDEP